MREPSAITTGNRRRSQTVRGIATDQAGSVSRAQLLAAGISGSAIDRALRSGTLHRIHSGVYATVGPELLTEEGHLVAALLAAGDGAILSDGTAAWHWRIIPAPPSVMQLAVPHRRTALAGVTLHERRRLRPDDTTHNGRFPTTPSLARCWTSRPATSTARCCAPWPKPSFTTTCVPPTSSARCAAGTPAAPTCAPPCTPTSRATARPRASSSGAFAGC
jgi:hypothetical protein